MRVSTFALMAVVLVLPATGCRKKNKDGEDTRTKIKADGSSTVGPLTAAAAEAFSEETGKRGITVAITGTGGGFKRFVKGETDISNASRPITAKEMAEAKENGVEYIELPICFDAITVCINPKNTWAKSITVAELKKMWEPDAQKKVMKWSQINKDWPDEEFKLFGPGADSGTFEYFTEAIVGKAKNSRGDFQASEDDNILVKGIEGDKNALGYFGYSYYAARKDSLQAVAIDWDKNKKAKGPVAPSMDNVLNGTYNPLSRPLFIYVNRKSAERADVKAFVEFYIRNAAKLSEKVKYLPLPEAAYKLVSDRFAKLETGTGFGGEAKIGLAVEDIMKMAPKH